MNKIIIIISLSLLLFGSVLAQEIHPIMRPDFDTFLEWMENYENAPKTFIDPEIQLKRGAFDLFDHLWCIGVRWVEC